MIGLPNLDMKAKIHILKARTIKMRKTDSLGLHDIWGSQSADLRNMLCVSVVC